MNWKGNDPQLYDEEFKIVQPEKYSRGCMWFFLWGSLALAVVIGLSIGAMALFNHFTK